MNLSQFITSEAFFTCSESMASPEMSSFHSMKGRWIALLNFFEKILIIPFAFIGKLFKTSFSLLGLAFSLFLLVVTLCAVGSLRAFFVRRVSGLAVDIADWIFWPIGVIFCLARLVLAATLHPALYFH